MKKAAVIIAVVVAAAVIVTLLIVKVWPGVLIGSRNLETEDYAFADFTEIEIDSAFQFEIAQSDSYGVNITADDNVIDYVQVSKDGETLKIRLATVPRLWFVTLRASVTMPQLRGLTVSGASRGTISGFSFGEDLSITVSGASRVTGEMTTGDIGFDVSGASSIQLEGSAGDMMAVVSGASRLNLDDFTVENANVNISGASSGTINLNGRLDASLSGASRLFYIGEPTMGDINTSGASTISKK